jgi:hypothetical protein
MYEDALGTGIKHVMERGGIHEKLPIVLMGRKIE